MCHSLLKKISKNYPSHWNTNNIFKWIYCSAFVSLWIGCLYNKQAQECQNLIIYRRTIAPLHHCTVRENANKSHHIKYLWQQEKNNPKPSLIVIMVATKKRTHPDHLLYLWQHKKMDSYWIPFIVNVINDSHNNSRTVKGRHQEK